MHFISGDRDTSKYDVDVNNTVERCELFGQKRLTCLCSPKHYLNCKYYISRSIFKIRNVSFAFRLSSSNPSLTAFSVRKLCLQASVLLATHVTNNNGDTSIVFAGKMFSLRGVDSATGHVVVNTMNHETFKFEWSSAQAYGLILYNHEWKKSSP